MLEVKRIEKKFHPDCSRVIVKPHVPQDEDRIKNIINRVLTLSDEKVKQLLDRVVLNFSKRHKNIWHSFDSHYDLIKDYIPQDTQMSSSKKALMGAYFSCEYSVQSAAFFNPSIVPHPDQNNLDEGDLRFIMSFRSVGEGHISSIEFRSGTVDKNRNFSFDKISHYAEKAKLACNPLYNRELFFLKLSEMHNSDNEIYKQIYDLLPDEFSMSDLMAVIQMILDPSQKAVKENIIWLAKSNYELHFNPDHDLSEKIIFPASLNDCNGIEDARFVQFKEDDGTCTYYATYTAYNGKQILPQLIETKDFNTFKISTLNGKFSKNKGMALFPRKINGKYMMISRVDGESLYLMSSDNIHFWQNAELLKEPEDGWEFVQIGNCGSPIETDEGWILLTHGVGPMREYSIGVILLDIDNPARIIGNIIEPLLSCNEDEREGYVPNVVYSCGAMVHNDTLIIPYAMSDTCSGIATISLPELFDKVKKSGANAYVESS